MLINIIVSFKSNRDLESFKLIALCEVQAAHLIHDYMGGGGKKQPANHNDYSYWINTCTMREQQIKTEGEKCLRIMRCLNPLHRSSIRIINRSLLIVAILSINNAN